MCHIEPLTEARTIQTYCKILLRCTSDITYVAHIKQLQNVHETTRLLRNESSLFPVYCDVKVSEDILCFK
jgi:hypothetical protein